MGSKIVRKGNIIYFYRNEIFINLLYPQLFDAAAHFEPRHERFLQYEKSKFNVKTIQLIKEVNKNYKRVKYLQYIRSFGAKKAFARMLHDSQKYLLNSSSER